MNKQYKVAFLFSSGKSAFGGHHVSVHEIINAIHSNYTCFECSVISFGPKKPVVFKNEDYVYTFDVHSYQLNSLINLRRFLINQKINVFLPFDEFSCRILFSVLPSSVSYTIPVKPGWINSSSWTNLTTDFVCFSKENYDFMKSCSKYRNVNVHLIPNRVSKVESDCERIIKFNNKFRENDELIIFAISRIDPDKVCVFDSAICLRDFISKKKKIKLFIIGKISSEETYQLLLSKTKDTEIEILTESYYTDNISSLMRAADMIVAMGRTSMESMSQGIPTFVPRRGKNQLPLIVSYDSFQSLLEANFTYRSKIDNDGINTNEKMILEFIDNYSKYSKMAINLYDEYLDVNSGISKYMGIIEKYINQRTDKSFMKTFRAYTYSFLRWILLDIYSVIKR